MGGCSSVQLAAGASIASLGSTGSLDVTRWLYDLPTGLLTNKLYADNLGPSYTYTPDGKLETRNWARGVTTTYAYTNNTGELIGIDYSDATPDVAFAYDRLGRQVAITDATGTRMFAYNDTLQLAAETNAFGVIVRAYDGLSRSAGFSLFNPANPVNPVQSITYGYSALGRFAVITSSVQSVSSVVEYSYLPGSDILSGWANSSGLAVTRTYETNRDLLTAVSNRYNGATVSAFDYVNDALARRTQRIDSGSAAATNQFGYNPRSELTSAAMGTNQFGYAYDPIGNRTSATNNAEALIYAANELNQYTNIMDGMTLTPLYDYDGNMTAYGDWTFTWSGENRLIQASNAVHLVSYAYDYQGRMFAKVVDGQTNGLAWDDFTIIAEVRSGVTNWNVWGLDISGRLQGAGGVGGLLIVNRNGTSYYPCYDANGNITDYVATNGAVAAHYNV